MLRARLALWMTSAVASSMLRAQLGAPQSSDGNGPAPFARLVTDQGSDQSAAAVHGRSGSDEKKNVASFPCPVHPLSGASLSCYIWVAGMHRGLRLTRVVHGADLSFPLFTICSCNFLPQARTLFESIQAAKATSNFVIFIVDGKRDYITSESTGCRIIYVDDIGIPNYDYMKFIYTIAELNTAVRPYCFRFLFSAMGQSSAVYLAPDTVLLRPLEHVELAFSDAADLVLTPHITAPIDDDFRPSEMDIIRAGTYNLGFVAIRNTAETRRFLGWWAKRVQRNCIFDIGNGYHVDQKVVDLAPGLVEKTKILRHPGYNLAYCNIAQRRLTHSDNQLLADGVPVHFVHFSSVGFANPKAISDHQNRLKLTDLGPLKDVYESYLHNVARNMSLEGNDLSREQYTYERFLDGRKIPQVLRRAYRELVSPHSGSFESLFVLNGALFNERAPSLPQFDGLKITKLYHYLWRSRADLQSTYNLHDFGGQCRYLAWAKAFLAQEVPPELITDVPREALDTCGIAGAFPLPVTAETIVNVFRPAFVARHYLHALLHGKERARTRLQRRLARMTATSNHSVPGATELKPGVALFGFFRTETGVGEVARRCADALTHSREPFTAHLLRAGPGYREGLDFEAIDAPWNAYDRAVICANADAVASLDRLIPEAALTGRRRTGYWNWELPVFPAAWAPAFWRIDDIWTPSTFSGQAIGVATAKPVHVVPIAVQDTVVDKLFARKKLGLDMSEFLVLTIFDVNSHIARKNPMAAVRAFVDAFATRKESRPRMVVKLHGAARRGAEFRELLAFSANAGITIIDDVFDRAKIRLLQAAADAFISLHRSEGFGLNIAECMSLAKPVVVTAFSGNMDFTNDTNSYLIPWKMRQVAPDEYPQGAGQWWAEPDHDAAVSALRSVTDQSARAAQRGARARTAILAHCSVATVSGKMSRLLADGNSATS
jgi:hypothetical protein